MSEKDALKNIVRFSDPRLHRVGFGIILTIFNPKEKTVLIYRKGGYDGIDPGLSVIPLDELQPLKLDEFCILGNRVYAVMMHIFACNDLGDYFRIVAGRLETRQYHDNQWWWDSVSIYHIIGRMNGIIGFLQHHMLQKDLEKLVWSEITHRLVGIRHDNGA